MPFPNPLSNWALGCRALLATISAVLSSLNLSRGFSALAALYQRNASQHQELIALAQQRSRSWRDVGAGGAGWLGSLESGANVPLPLERPLKGGLASFLCGKKDNGRRGSRSPKERLSQQNFVLGSAGD